jgi:hypothetical protein
MLGKQDVDIQIWFIDATSLKVSRPAGSRLFHAAELVKRCDGSSCGNLTEYHAMAMNFASVFDEILVLGGVPPKAIIGNVSLPELLQLLPQYFFTKQPHDCPTTDHCEYLVYQNANIPFRTAHGLLQDNVAAVDDVRGAYEQADLSLRFALRVCRDISLPEQEIRDLLRRLAFAAVNWLIRWEDTIIPAFDSRWKCRGSVWITEYLNHRIAKDPLPRCKPMVSL